MILIINSPTYGPQEVLYDKEDHYLIRGKIGFYAKTNVWYKGKNKSLYLHRLVMGNPEGMIVDHINHNTLDCRKENLRICSISQNNMNTLKPRNAKSSKYKGVSFDKKRNKFESYLHFDNKKLHLGYHIDEVEAAKSYNEAALEYFGEYANLNAVEGIADKVFDVSRRRVGDYWVSEVR